MNLRLGPRKATFFCLLLGILVPVLSHADPVITTPSSLFWGNVMVGTSVGKSLLIQNTGNSTLVVSSMTITGSTDYSLPPDLVLPFEVAPNSSVNVTITFAPTSTGAKSGTVHIGSNDPATPTKSVTLTGAGAAPRISAPSTFDFGPVDASSFRDSSLTISNTGNMSLTVSAIRVTGPDSASFAWFGASPPFVVPAAGSRSITLRFTPASADSMNAMLVLTSNDPDSSTKSVALSGTGISTVGVHDNGPLVLALAHPVPHPVRGGAEFVFTLPNEGEARLSIFDGQGRRVAELIGGVRPAGRQSARWDGRDGRGRQVPDGIYFARLTAATRTVSVRFVRVR